MDEFEIPEDPKALPRKDRDAAIKAARAEAKAIDAKGDDLSDEDVDRLEALADFIAAASTANTEEEQADDARKARVAAARARVADEPDEDEPEPEDEPTEDEQTREVEPVTASATAPARRTGVARRAASGAPRVDPPEQTERPRATILASVDALGAAAGGELTMDQLVDAAMKRFQAMPRGKAQQPARQAYGLANIVMPRTDGLSTENPEYKGDFMRLVRDAADESRLPGKSLTAAAGWCPPSETVYDLCPGLESTDGLWDLPSINISRGGINFTKGPTIADVFDHAGFWHYTEAQVIAGVTKPCFTVPCPTFQEVRLEVDGVCIKAGILQREGYPEIIRRYVELSLTAHVHQMSARRLQAAQTIAGAAVSAGNVWDNTNSIFTALELLAIGERERIRMPRNQTLEIVLPHWVLAAIRADVANRTAMPFEAVTDQQITAHFTARNLRPQFIYDYQPLTYVNGVVRDFPDTVEVLMYPAGTFVAAGKDLLNLQAVYDSTDLRSNEYTELFSEESYAVLNTCYDARRISIPLTVTGRTGAANIVDEYYTPAV